MRTAGKNIRRDHFKKSFETKHPIEPRKTLHSNINAWTKIYLDYKKDVDKLSVNTIQNYKDTLKYVYDFAKEHPQSANSFSELDHNFINAFMDAYLFHLLLGDDEVVFFDDMTDDEVDELFNEYGPQHYSTLNKRLTVIKQWLGFVSEHNIEGINFKNCFNQLIKYPEPKKHDLQHESLSEEGEKLAIERLFQWPDEFKQHKKRSNRYCANRDALAVLTMLLAGTRAKETTQIKRKDIDIDAVKNKEIVIRMHGKGNKERDVEIDTEYFPEYLNMLNEQLANTDAHKESFLFATVSGKPVSDRDLFKFAREFFKNNDIDDEVFLHKLRHSYATLYVSRGGDINVLKSLMGHDNLSTTQIYAVSNKERKREIRKAVGQRARKK